MTSRPDLARVLDVLEKAHGKPKPPPTTEPFEIARAGIVAGSSVEKLRRTAAVALEQFGGDLRSAMKRPLPEARKALKKFPLCRRSRPRCEACPVASVCVYYQTATPRH
jgi:endonuclease III